MKILVKATELRCTCGWALPVELSVIPKGFLKSFLSTSTVDVQSHLEALEFACGGCGKKHVQREVVVVA